MASRYATTLCLVVLLVSPASADGIADAIAKPGRLPADLARDRHSKPEVVLPLLNLKPGDRVVDIFGSGGYHSELLASVVGPGGEVLLHNNRGFRAWGQNILADRFTDRSPGSITQHDREIDDLDLGRETLDGAILVMAFHDLYVVPKRYNGEAYVPVGESADVGHFMAQVHGALKPGARFVVVDHSASDATPLAEALELHRIHESFARSEIEGFGFSFIAASDALKNPHDDVERIVFDSDLQGRTSRFVLVFEKP